MPRQMPPGRSTPAPLLMLAAALLAGMATPAAAQQTVSEAQMLRTGQFLWDEDGVSGRGDLSISIDIAQQRIHVYRAGQLIGTSTVSTGTKGHATPPGNFTILQKNMWHRSNLYSNAPMPYMQRLTWTGIALHAGHLPGYPASHGCIRLPTAFARRLFAITSLGVPVTIMDGKRRPLVKLQFADIEWLTGDDRVLAPPAAPLVLPPAQPRPSAPPPRRPAATPALHLIDERTLPAATTDGGPHWVDTTEIEAVRRRSQQPRLDFEPVPQ